MTTYDPKLPLFTPAEAAQITGVTTDSQRDWRRRDILPTQEGEARYNVFDLAKLTTIHLFSNAGYGLKHALDWCPYVPAAILRHALHVDGTIDGDANGHTPEVIAAKFSKVLAADCLVGWADGTVTAESDPEAAQLRAPADKLAGFIRIADLQIIGEELARRAGRPLVSFEGE